MKTAALLEKHGTKYFKIGLSGLDNYLKQKLRIMRGFRKVGLNYYFLPYTDDAVDFLLDNKFEFNGAFNQLQKKDYEKQNPIDRIPKYEKQGLKLYKYQLEGVNFIEYHKGRALIADVMGLGKTVQALGWVQFRKDVKKVLIICPSSLKINWQEEFEKWVSRPFKIQIIEGTTPYPITGDVVIINYDILNSWIVELKLTHFDVCIADELHYCKNHSSQRAKAFIEITKGIQNLIGLTGTPIENDPMEIFYLVNLINKNIFPNYVKFIERYCDAKLTEQRVHGGKVRKIWKRNGFTNQAELHRILKKHVMIRRTKEQVDLQLPPKTYANIDLKIDNWQVYLQAENDFIKYIKESFDAKAAKQLHDNLHPEELDLDEKLDAISRAPALAKIQALKMLAAQGKMQQVIDWIKDFLETDEKLIVFTINKVIVKTLMDAFPFAVKIDGSTSKEKRNEAVKSFQNDPKCRLFIGNMKAAGIGLTLTAASKVAIVQFPWNPGELVQAEDRAHRITQKEKVTIYKFVAKNTIEERIVQLLKNKQIEIDKIIDGKNIKVNTDLVKLLIDSYK
jgi:SWI/SNF-related matrix-associated actin-dependent regulator of chromatin subfamily A-like protein 1